MADQEDLLTCMRGLIKEHKRAKKKKRDSLKRKAGRMEGADSSGDGFSPHGSGSSSCSSSSTQTTASSTSSTFDVVMNGLDKEANFVERLLREAETQSPHYVALVRSNQAVDALLALIKYSMKREVSRTESLDVLFRADSNCTNLMKVYARMVGLSYLYQTLEPLINRVWLHPDNYEIENSLITKKDLKRNLEKLTVTVQLFIDTIVESIRHCPPSIRELCKEMRKAAEKKWEGAAADSSYIGGFIFLRLFCPAIVSPVKYQLISAELAQKDPEKVQKTLLVITKTLQKAANNSVFAKGQHLACLNPVITSNQEPISHFLQEMSLSDTARRKHP
jgi:hypothetical protein